MNSITFGDNNRGGQVGINNGKIYFAAERPETPPAPLSTVPFRRDPDFVNRRTLLGQIDEKGSLPGARVALVGLGGVGKSQLAIEYTYRVQERSPDTWVFWIHAGNAVRFEQSCREIADRVKMPGRQNPQTNTFKLLCDWLHDARRKWMLILDNLDDDQFLHEQNCQGNGIGPIWTYFSSLSGLILVTSRSKRAASSIVEDGDIVTVEAMDENHAISLFEKKLGPQENIEDRIQLAAALEFIPLAIVQAAAYIKQRTPRMSVVQYLEQFQSDDRRRISLLNYKGGYIRRDREAKSAILLTWQISFDHIQEKRPSASDLLSLMSFFDRQGIPDYLIEQDRKAKGLVRSLSAASMIERQNISHMEEDECEHDKKESFEDDILILKDYSLISISADGASFEMHRLVQIAMQEWLKTHERLETWKECFIKNLHDSFPSGLFENWTKCQVLFAHVLRAEAQRPFAKGPLKRWAGLLHQAALFASTRGYLIDSRRLAEKAMIARREVFGARHEKTIQSSSALGLAYLLTGHLEKAEELLVKVMNISKEVLGPEHNCTITAMTDLALTYQDQGRWKEAEQLQVKILDSTQQALGLEHPDTPRGLISISNLAVTYLNQGRWKEAEELEVQVMNSSKRVLGLEHPDTLVIISNLGATYRDQGRWKEAEELLLQAINTQQQILGPEHPDTLTSIASLASTYWNQGKWNEAEELEVQVMNSSKRVLGLEHPYTLIIISNLASTYLDQGRWKEAEELLLQAINIQKRVLGSEHPTTLTSTSNLALAYRTQGRHKEAEELLLHVIGTRKHVLGPEHPSTLSSMANLAHTMRSLGQDEAAFRLMAKCAQIRQRKLGPDHPLTASSNATLKKWCGVHVTQLSQSLQAPVVAEACGDIQSITAQTDEPRFESSRKRWRPIFSRLFSRK